MGWIRGLGPTKLAHDTRDIHTSGSEAKAGVDHVENVRRSPGEDAWYQPPDLQKPENKYPFQESTVADEDLPFISSEEVVSKRRPGALSCQAEQSKERKDYWIVVDEIVYDCTSFISDHPGGEQVILSFVGEDCSWQFWRFHGKNEMLQYGKNLRIGRTSGLVNRFAEPVRFVGLAKFGDDDW